MKKLNNKGFVLMETLIVSVFVMSLFMVLYTDLFPLLGEYKRRENYDDIDSKYTAHYIRMMVLENGTEQLTNGVLNNGYVDMMNCSSEYFTDTNYCITLKEKFNITKMYLAEYNIKKIKEFASNLPNTENENLEFKEYMKYLQEFDDTGKESYQRIIVEVEHENYKTYGTIEVMRGE